MTIAHMSSVNQRSLPRMWRWCCLTSLWGISRHSLQVLAFVFCFSHPPILFFTSFVLVWDSVRLEAMKLAQGKLGQVEFDNRYWGWSWPGEKLLYSSHTGFQSIFVGMSLLIQGHAVMLTEHLLAWRCSFLIIGRTLLSWRKLVTWSVVGDLIGTMTQCLGWGRMSPPSIQIMWEVTSGNVWVHVNVVSYSEDLAPSLRAAEINTARDCQGYTARATTVP